MLYPDRRITKIDLGTSLSESPFTVLETDCEGMLATGNQLLVYLAEGLGPHAVLFNQTGAITSNVQYPSQYFHPYWDGPLNEIIFPAASEFSDFSVQSGAIGTVNNFDFNASFNPTGPLRFSADGSQFVDGNGIIYNASTFAQSGVLGNSIVDAAWLGNTVYSLSNTASGSELDAWTPPSYLKSSSAQLTGSAGAVWATSGSSVLALTNTPPGPQFSTFDGAANLLSQSSPVAPPLGPPEIIQEPADAFVAPGGTATFSVLAAGNNLSYVWYGQTGSALGTGPTLTITDVSQNQAGSYTVVVTGNGTSVGSDAAELVVTGPPLFLTEPYGFSTTLNQTVIFMSGILNSVARVRNVTSGT